MKKALAIWLMCCCVGLAYATADKEEICLDFPILKTQIDTTYKQNAAQEMEMVRFLQAIRQDSTVHIHNVTFRGVTSPDGTCALNTMLAQKRLASLEKWIRAQVIIPDSLVQYQSITITWDNLKPIIAQSNFAYKDTVLAVLNQPSSLPDSLCLPVADKRMLQLKKLHNGVVWKELNQQFFSHMRKACVVVSTNKKQVVLEQPIEMPQDTIEVAQQPVMPDTLVADTLVADTLITDTIPAYTWTRQLTLKTNALYWAVGMANAAVDIDLCQHWSLSIPVFYSAWDYFVNDIKFRFVGLQPEIRYWIKDTNQDGWFVGAHFGMAYWNVAVNGAYRYQDRNREEPALGGGVGFGYRMPLSKNGKWKVEFALGLGVYNAPYDKFENVPNGQLVESGNYIYWGIDQAAVSFSYTFNLTKKGGKQ